MQMKRPSFWGLGALLGLSIAAGLPGEVQAQSSMTYSASNQWGTMPGGVSVNGALDSAAQAATNAAVAGAANGAKKGVLMGSNVTINSIGSQTIISNTIFGSNNPTNITASQSASNSGSVSNTGTVNAQ
jgi:hypothetical protein